MTEEKIARPLFGQRITAINVGLSKFAESLEAQGIETISLDWRPSAEVPTLTQTSTGVEIDAANAEALARIGRGRPMIVGMGQAKDVLPGMHDNLILHAGPPVTWGRMCGPMRGAVIGALIYERMASTPEDAESIAAGSGVEFEPCHHHHTVGPMAGVVSPSMPVWIIRNEEFDNYAYCTLNEGLGKVLRYGAYGSKVIKRLEWIQLELFPALQAALEISGPIDLRSMVAQALHMGDECHNRNKAGTSLFLRTIAPALAEAVDDSNIVARVLRFIDGNDHFFLNLSMPAMKAMLEPAEGIEGSTIVTTMARNGTDFGIRVSGLGNKWYTAPAGMPQGLWLPGYTAKDANPDIGDSTITETGGIGGFALAGAPAIVQFVGGTPQDAVNATMDMYEITAGEHPAFTIPAFNFRGTPLGIDIRKVVETGILPRLNTGIAHKEPGVGMVGAGLLEAPMDCFKRAFTAFEKLCEIDES